MYASTTPTLFPQRGEPVLYTVRAELVHTSPPLWRRVELASDLYLDDVHDVLQTVFGWDDGHLHKFGRGGKRFYDRNTAHFLSPYDVDEGQRGLAEQQVRLDEVLEHEGDRLLYLYDFGDDWELSLTLRGIAPLTADTPRARCVDGRRPSPVDDSGGPFQYEFWEAVNDPGHPEHAEAVAEYRAEFGEDDDPSYRAPKPFDRDKVNEGLRRLFPEPGPAGEERRSSGENAGARLPGPVADLLIDAAYAGPEAERLLSALVDRAGLDTSAEVDEDTARRMVAPYAWLLDRAGTEGLPLTQAGYLKPADVEAAADVLGLRGDWIGKLNREDQTAPVRVFRETAQRMKLLRRYRGRLMRTPAGRKTGGDPVALWTHLAERMPADEGRAAYSHGGLLSLLALAGGDGDVLATTGRALTALGWRDHSATDRALSPGAVFGLCGDSHSVLTFLGALTGRGMDARPTPEGRLFARAALRNWPREG
ncbi:plasmid pRiA4b ORF-3 family protein [Nocardiopsis sp. N85]|uniref:plasmid pRiA4b ORF-3 family protein n=1 Tax=Nocardiopsis sp. N85 TaxID=3029400 RepID=UPI00237FAFE0|nr:plasmid pRiA4b ORF-3 family protein [Nocardiopsis sp. N85]MDE3719941.1 plasmid pRiA4b ORF-3 family protein [Nocardiopsis sp. N85]